MDAATPPAPAPAVPWTLRGAAAIASTQALVESVAVAGRSTLTPGLRGVLIASLGLTWLLAWGVVRLRAGAALGLLLLEGTTVVAAFGAVEAAGPVRAALGAGALASIVLLLASLHAFPAPTLPATWHDPTRRHP